MNLRQIDRLFQTVRHLRPVQVTNRLMRTVLRPRDPSGPTPECRDLKGNWTTPAQRPRTLAGPRRIRVFQQEIDLASPDSWNDVALPYLVRYNLHYFDDLNAAEAIQRRDWHRELMLRWIDENPSPSGCGWEPYPLSLRIVNWIKYFLSGECPTLAMLRSLADQTRSLHQQLEFHLLANHLFANAKALVFAGVFFQGSQADRWLQQGLQILKRQIDEQILSDGGHFELSPMYHSIILEDLLDLLNLSQTWGEPSEATYLTDLQGTIGAMRRWLQVMCHTDGKISFFNDAAWGISPSPQELDDYALRLGLGALGRLSERTIYLPDSGYVRVQIDDSVALLDVARVGPDYQPGHAHADTLSFEWSLGDSRVIVNSGTSCYGTSAERLRQRSTAAHNTVVVDDEDSSEVWSGFRVARRARPFDILIRDLEDRVEISAAHTGYRRLAGRVTHRRRWHFSSGSFQVVDQLEGRYDHAEARLHIHPDWSLTEQAPTQFMASNGQHSIHLDTTGSVGKIAPSSFHPEFDRSIPSSCLETKIASGEARIKVTWSD